MPEESSVLGSNCLLKFPSLISVVDNLVNKRYDNLIDNAVYDCKFNDSILDCKSLILKMIWFLLFSKVNV